MKRSLSFAMLLAVLGLGAAGSLAALAAAEDVPAGVMDFFKQNCVKCHKGKFPPKGLNLEADNVLKALDVPSQGVPADKIIDTSNPGSSYILKKVQGGSGIKGRRMPPGKALASDKIAVLQSWLMSLQKTD